MPKVAIIETKPSRNNYTALFDERFTFDLYQLCSDMGISKVLKKDVDIDIDLDAYEWIILVGSEPFKYYTKNNSITSYSGRIVDEKFLPVINPAMLKFKPEARPTWEESKTNIIGYITGDKAIEQFDTSRFVGIENTEEAIEAINKALNAEESFVALDSETTDLYPRNGYMLGLSLTWEDDQGVYITTDCVTEEIENKLQQLFNEKTVVFHNAKFDIAFFEYHFGFKFPYFEDTMLMHYVLDENQSHGLKELALKYTKYGDYEKPLQDWRKQYCREHGIKQDEFTYDLIPFDIIKQYAAIDTCVTFLLYKKFSNIIKKNNTLLNVYNNILIPGCRLLIDVQDNGVPFDKDRLIFSQNKMQEELDNAINELNNFHEISIMEEETGTPFNPNSTVQLRKLLFDYIGLKPTGKLTGTGAHSTDKEVLEQLALLHPIPKHILEVRQSGKIKNTYLDKIIPQLDRDSKLRTNFNQHVASSGRLSSSGKLNMQQLPRDNPTVKGCIKASAGHKIVNMDLATAEMYIAAAVSGDLELQDVFKTGGDFHSTIAKKVFNLDCPVEDVKALHAIDRQAAKSVSFGILYGSGPAKVVESVNKEGGNLTLKQAKMVINDYFNTFSSLKDWIDDRKSFILVNAYIYSPLGRKRRLVNVRSDNQGVQGHEIRSGLNFVIQSTASDINLLGAIDMQRYIKENGMKAKIFALVHDSVLAEVPEEEIEHYTEKLKYFIQYDRGVGIKGFPIGCDFEIGDDYSMGKFSAKYGNNI